MAYRVHLLETDRTFDVEGNESVLEAALRTGVKLPHECQFGGCGTCRIKVCGGQYAYDEFPMGLTEEEHAAGYALACQARPRSDLSVSVASRSQEFAEPIEMDVLVHGIERLTPDVFHLTLRAPEPVDFRAGQYVNIVLEDGTTRSFSMATPPRGDLLDFHVRRIAGGRFTERLAEEIRADHRLKVALPLGVFCYHEEDWRPLVMAATGTGIAPIKAMLQSLLDNEDCPPVSLYWGMRTEADLYLRDEIASWQDRLYEFNFVPVLSRAPADWQGRRGHVQHAVAEDFDDLSEHAIYLCGSPDMIRDATSLFAARGASLDHLYADGFSFQHHIAPVS